MENLRHKGASRRPHRTTRPAPLAILISQAEGLPVEGYLMVQFPKLCNLPVEGLHRRRREKDPYLLLFALPLAAAAIKK